MIKLCLKENNLHLNFGRQAQLRSLLICIAKTLLNFQFALGRDFIDSEFFLPTLAKNTFFFAIIGYLPSQIYISNKLTVGKSTVGNFNPVFI